MLSNNSYLDYSPVWLSETQRRTACTQTALQTTFVLHTRNIQDIPRVVKQERARIGRIMAGASMQSLCCQKVEIEDMFARISNSWELVKASWAVLRSDK